MNHRLLLCALVLTTLIGGQETSLKAEAAPPIRVDADHAADVTAIKALAAAYQAAYLKGDPKGISALYAEDAIIHPANQSPVRGRSNLDAYFIANYTNPVNETLTTVAIVVSEAGDMAYEVGRTMSATGAGKYLTIYRKFNGRWLIAADTWSHDSPP